MESDADISERKAAELECLSYAYPEATITESRFVLVLQCTTVDIMLPAGYPCTAPAFELYSDTQPEVWMCDVRESIQEVIQAAHGEECLLQMVHVLSEALSESEYSSAIAIDECPPASTATTADMMESTGDTTGDNEAISTPQDGVCYMVIRFDHIKARHARKIIAEEAIARGLGVFCRAGKPGIVLVEGIRSIAKEYFQELKRSLGTCTRTMGCWGPANQHFQSINVAATLDFPDSPRRFHSFEDMETETLMHLGGTFEAAGLLDLFFEATGLNRGWQVPKGTGGQDPYLKPRGGTKMKKINKRLH